MLEEILKVVQEALPKLQSDAVLKRLQEADAADREVATLKGWLSDKIATVDKLSKVIEDFEGRTQTAKALDLRRDKINSDEIALNTRIAVLEAVTSERDRHHRETHELLMTLFRNTTIRKETAQAVAVPTFNSEWHSGSGGNVYQQSGAYTESVPVTETITEE